MSDLVPNPQDIAISSNVRPDWLVEDKTMGTDELSQFIIPPRLVITQPLSNTPLDRYPVGTPIIMPAEEVIGEFDRDELCLVEPFYVVPLFFFTEYTIDNPREIAAAHGAVRERTFDPTSQIAIKAGNPKLREFPCPEKPDKMCKYVARLNYVLYLMSEQHSQAVLFTFKKGEFRNGMAFNSLIKARKAPLFSCQFAADVGFRENEQGKWYGLDVSNPPEQVGGWVTNKELYDQFKEEHLRFAEAHANKLILPDLENEDGTSASAGPEPEM